MPRAICILPPKWALIIGSVLFSATIAHAGTPDIERGEKAFMSVVLEPSWPAESFENAWKVWGLKEKPADYEQQFRLRYGLHPAPYENSRLPMGLKHIERFGKKFITTDCLLCHGGSFDGRGYVGMPNAQLDYQLLYDEMYQAAGFTPLPTPFVLSRARGTTNCNAAGTFVLLLRDEDLNLRLPLGGPDWTKIPDMDIRSLWQWRRKKTLYVDGVVDGRSPRSMMMALASSPFVSAQEIKDAEPEWEQIRAYLKSLRTPKYPLEIDAKLAASGQELFAQNCAECHGTYDDQRGGTGGYPNKIVPIEEIGTDRAHFDSLTAGSLEIWNKSWFGRKYAIEATQGYQAPPLDGIWATAPYFHNASVPTVEAVLDSTRRPARFSRPLTTNAEDYDSARLGWKYKELAGDSTEDAESALPHMRRSVYDASAFGQSNAGHTFGDHFSDTERRAVIEFLKTL